MTFRELFLAGKIPFDDIFDLTDQWNFSDDPRTLREFLGLTAEEEDIWISDSDEALEEFMISEKKRKIFFTDLDATLLDDEKRITPGNREAIEQLKKQGHVLVLSTGRTLAGTLKHISSLGLMGKNCYISCYNGGVIYDTEQKKIIYRRSIPAENVRFAFDQAREFGIDIQTYTEKDVIVTEKDNPNLHIYENIQKLQHKVVPDVIDALQGHEPSKVLALDYEDHDHVVAFRDYMIPRCAGKMDVFLSHPALVELVPSGVNKGAALEYLCNYLGIAIENSVSAGDEENDLSMILRAGTGCAMVNGVDLLKEKADYVTAADNNHDGVAEILHKFVLRNAD